MWNKLNYDQANFERFREVFTQDSGNQASDSKRKEFCSWLATHKPSTCGTDPGQSAFTPDGCTNPIPGSGQWNTAFNSPCNGHDRCYSRMGANKGSCDGRFFGSMSDVCREKYAQGSSKMYTLCGVVSYAYYNAVSSPIGSYFFNAAQSGLGCVGWHALRKKYCNG